MQRHRRVSYDSGSGSGPFGLGWNLSLPRITRKTDKGLPTYQDGEESDVFILSGAEDLVPVLIDDGGELTRHSQPRTLDGIPYRVQHYRPRVEGLFARIERWTNQQTGEIHWRSISRDNVTTLYGRTHESRIADPDDPLRIFSWLICESYDDKGNAIVYRYKAEDSVNVDRSQVHERNRTDLSRSANRYLKRIYYGNQTPRQPGEDLSERRDWMFEVVFDYEDGHLQRLETDDEGRQFVEATIEDQPIWPVRQDPMSSYRAGFEVRTYRLCQRVLMFHHFPDELGAADYLVRATHFGYLESNINTVLASVIQSGYLQQENGTYQERSLPPVEFEYSQAEIQREVHEIDSDSLENLPVGLSGSLYRWVDLDGEGISGILTEQGSGWFYKPNLGNARFAPLETVTAKPSLAALNGGQQLLDLAGDGQLDLVTLEGPAPGFFERTFDRSWADHRAFASVPSVDWNDPNLRFVDLTGDGHADVLVTEDRVFTWYLSLAEEGYGPSRRTSQSDDDETGPRLVFADATQSIYLADMSGDGLIDLVRIGNGRVCYWPNLGYGRFGTKVTMDDAPWFEAPDLFDQRRIRLADVDGSGITDILYLQHDRVAIYFNQAGNGWAAAQFIDHFPSVDNLSDVTVTDLLGNGTACLVWSSPLPGDVNRQMRYIDLMGGQKPHLMIGSRNNLGAETRVQYAASTKFYLEDKAAGRPWITRLPFPVHVVERTETYDHISRNRFVSRYSYHHGHFDGIEREFHGFGVVEQFDTEEFAALNQSDAFPTGDNIEQSSHIPPVLTRSWFHTGAYIGGLRISRLFQDEYYREPALSDDEFLRQLLPDTVMPAGLSAEAEREAARSLKGVMLRQEVYALDNSERSEHPYTVTEQNFTIQPLQSHGPNRHAVFFTHTRETISYHYERKLVPILNGQIVDEPTAAADPNTEWRPDPRIQHALTLEVDEYGNVLKEAAVGYGRRQPDATLPTQADRDKQTRTLITYTENRVTNAIEAEDDYRTPLLCETRTFELTGYTPSGPAGRFEFPDLVQPDLDEPNRLTLIFDSEVPYEEETAGGRQRRLIEHVRTLYRPDDLGEAQNDPLTLLPLGTVEPLVLPGESYQLAFTPGLLAQVFQRDGQPLLANPAAVLGGQGADRGGYVDLDNNDHWWIPAGRVFLSPNSNDTATQELAFARQHFFLPHRYRDPFHTDAVSTESFITYDTYDLLMVETRDALENRVTVGGRTLTGEIDPNIPGNDYRVLQPRLVMDPNRNRTEVAFDVLGMVLGTAVMGKPEETLGDSLDGFSAELTEAEILDHLVSPLTDPHAILGRATSRLVYDLFAYDRTRDQSDPQPAVVYTLARETHDADLQSGQQTLVQHSFSYSDGFGREIQKKIQAEPGPAPERDAEGNIIVGADGQPEMTEQVADPRWVGSSWMVFNNKEKPVRQYEPFFTDTHRFEFDVRIGVSPTLFYDPVERIVATLHPNHTWEKVVFDAWRQETWDASDTVLVADPQTDPDVGDFFRRLLETDYLPSWHALRTDPAHAAEAAERWPDAQQREDEASAAAKAAVHAETPTVAHADSLGRTFLTVAHNRFQHTPPADPPVEEFYETRIVFDIEGNERAVIDALGRVVMRYDYDMLANRIHEASMEAGERWMLNDVGGNPLRAWDSRDHEFRTAYDQLRRPVESFVSEGAGEERLVQLVQRTVYGESQPDPETNNLRGRPFELFDGAGVVTSERYDFKGNLLRSNRQLAVEYRETLDWSDALPLEPEGYANQVEYDALDRPVAMTMPDNSIIRPSYNEANLLERVETSLRGAATATLFVSDIDYNAKGQRELIAYGNGVRTTYGYDPLTFRLTSLETQRGTEPLQGLHYTYDPTGNITHIRDDAQQTIFFNNAIVEPHSDYTYDALHRLIAATGREHSGQAGAPQTTWNDAFRVNLPHPHDGQAMRRYTERYEYDGVGNILELIHQATGGNWRRAYTYNEPSQLEPGRTSNRLSRTAVHPNGNQPIVEPYTHDVHGNMTAMPHLSLMQWDYRDQLQATAQQVVNNGGTPKTTYYVYDAAGQRVRKVTERQADSGQEPTRMAERLYLGGFEVYREYAGDGESVNLERETLHVMDDQQRIALIETLTMHEGSEVASPTPRLRYQLGNHLGSASLELDQAGAIISYEEYYPFGATAYQAVSGGLEVSAKRYRYTGKERDEETGLYYHGARYYACWLGRWTAGDPIGLGDGPNRYAYVHGNPVSMRDPGGTLTQDPEAIMQRLEAQRGPATKEQFGIPEKGPKAKGPSEGAPAERPSKAVPKPEPKATPERAVSSPGDVVLEFDEHIVLSDPRSALLEMATEDLALSDLAYRRTNASTPPEGYARLSSREIEALGINPMLMDHGNYQATLFRNERTGAYVLANRGSQQLGDWADDIFQALGFVPEHYLTAMELGRQVYNATGGNVRFTGHSLGGGLAAVQAMTTGGHAVTFNAAGPTKRMRNIATGFGFKPAASITNFRVEGDIVTWLQESIPAIPLGVEAAGTQATLPDRQHWYLGRSIHRHLIDPGVRRALDRERPQSP